MRGAFAGCALMLACGGTSVRHDPPSNAAGTGASSAGTGASSAGTGATEAGAGSAGIGTSAAGMLASGGGTDFGGTTNGSAAGASNGGSSGAESPPCPPDMVPTCDPGPGALCAEDACEPGPSYPSGGKLERGDGVICKFLPDGAGPDFGCFDGEWCELELHECRCGRHPGCQLGERCALCDGSGCESGEYACQRDVGCTGDNLDACAAEPGETCDDGATTCGTAEACPNTGDGSTQCDGAPGGCCPPGHWCFDQRQCRCGAHPACAASEFCAPDGVGLYACSALPACTR